MDGKATPDAAEKRGDKEEAEGRQDQQAGEIIDILRPEFEIEEVEAAIIDIQQDCLIGLTDTPVPPEPGHDVVESEAKDQNGPLQGTNLSRYGFRINLFVVLEILHETFGFRLRGLIRFRLTNVGHLGLVL